MGAMINRSISAEANELLKGVKDKTVLEAGCGSASYFSFDDVARMVGIDIDGNELSRNNALHDKICGDLETYQLPKAAFDIIVCWDVIEHLSRPEQALHNMCSAVKPGGLLILGFPHLLSFKGLVTKATPLWFHKAFYRFLKHSARNFPTYLRTAILPGCVIKLAQEENFSVAHSVLYEGGVTKRVRRLWLLNVLLTFIDKLWRLVTASARPSLFLDNCALICQKMAEPALIAECATELKRVLEPEQ